MPGVLLSGAESAVILDSDPAAVRRSLDEAARTGASHVVYRSSASVYGAWPDNPVPLSEATALRPNPGADFAVGYAEAERLVSEWKEAGSGRTVTVLRPAITVGAGPRERLSPLLAGYAGVAVRGASRPVQVVHAADVDRAVALAAERRLDGTFNVAPDGWIPDSTARAVAGGPLRVALPEPVVEWLTRVSPAVLAYAVHPWVVANDRLRAEGWAPTHTNEEALVATQAASWRDMSPRRRQEVALGATGVALAGTVAGAVALLRRSRRK